MAKGAELLGESFIFCVAGGIVVVEYNNSKEKERRKEEERRRGLDVQRREFVDVLHKIHGRLDWLENVVEQQRELIFRMEQRMMDCDNDNDNDDDDDDVVVAVPRNHHSNRRSIFNFWRS